MKPYLIANTGNLTFSKSGMQFATRSEADAKAKDLANQYVGVDFIVYEQVAVYGHKAFV